MPKARRKKKAINVVKRARAITKNEERSIFTDGDILRTDHDSLNQSNPISAIPRLLHTPSPEITPSSFYDERSVKERECSLETTPKNSRRNLCFPLSYRLNTNCEESLTSKLTGLSPLYHPESKENEFEGIRQSNFDKNRTKTRSPHKLKSKFLPEEAFRKREDGRYIFETPRNIGSFPIHQEEVQQEDIIEVPKRVNRNLCRSKSENEILQLQGIVNLNPYMKYNDIKVKSFKENSINEQSFFTPELLKSKPASTPIHPHFEKENHRIPLHDISNSNQTPISRSYLKKPKPLMPSKGIEPIVKIIEEENIKINKKVARILSKTAPPGFVKSPIKIVHYKRAPFHFQKDFLSVSYKSLIEDSSNDTLGTLRRILKGLQRYGAATVRWTMSLFSLFVRLGTSLRHSISSLCSYCGSNGIPETSKTCKCSEYHHEIGKLSSKINDLSTNLVDLRSQLLENIQNNKKIETLNANLEEMSKDLNSLKSLEKEVDGLRQQLRNVNVVSKPQVMSVAAPPPPPPPPPPLPPPGSMNKPLVIVKSNSNNTKLKNETPRPTISLDDILKVKLKKTSERQTNPRRITKQPEVSLEMLQQVKLRKSGSRPMTPSSLPEISSEGSTSPHSSLKRLLREDSSFKIKRLRRVGGYSFDDLHKKNLSKQSRERL